MPDPVEDELPRLARIREILRQWEQGPAPCGIPHSHPYNPCLPERESGRLRCVTCGLLQRLAIT